MYEKIINGKTQNSLEYFNRIILLVNKNGYIDISKLDLEIYCHNEQEVTDKAHDYAGDAFLQDVGKNAATITEDDDDSDFYQQLFEDFYFVLFENISSSYLIDNKFNQWIFKNILEFDKYIFYISNSEGGTYLTFNNIKKLLKCSDDDIKFIFINYKLPFIYKPRVYDINVYDKNFQVSVMRLGSFLYANAEKCNP